MARDLELRRSRYPNRCPAASGGRLRSAGFVGQDAAPKTAHLSLYRTRSARPTPYKVELGRSNLLTNLAMTLLATFERHGMSVPVEVPIGLTSEYVNDFSRKSLLLAFLKENELPSGPLPAIPERLRIGLAPALNTVDR